MGRQIDRWVDKEMGKWTDGKTDRQTDIKRHSDPYVGVQIKDLWTDTDRAD